MGRTANLPKIKPEALKRFKRHADNQKTTIAESIETASELLEAKK